METHFIPIDSTKTMSTRTSDNLTKNTTTEKKADKVVENILRSQSAGLSSGSTLKHKQEKA